MGKKATAATIEPVAAVRDENLWGGSSSMESVRLSLTRGAWSWIDEPDYPFLSRFNWCLNRKEHGDYAVCHIRGYGYASLHGLLMETPPGMCVDHINGDGLDNRRSNLRVVTQALNMRNTAKRRGCASRFKGVNFNKARKVWLARITKDGRHTAIGSFKTEEEAALAYNESARRIFGEYARLNTVTDLSYT